MDIWRQFLISLAAKECLVCYDMKIETKCSAMSRCIGCLVDNYSYCINILRGYRRTFCIGRWHVILAHVCEDAILRLFF